MKRIYKDSIKVDPYASAKCVEHFDGLKTVEHVPREISWHVYIFIKKEEGWISGKVICVKVSAITNTVKRPGNPYILKQGMSWNKLERVGTTWEWARTN